MHKLSFFNFKSSIILLFLVIWHYRYPRWTILRQGGRN